MLVRHTTLQSKKYFNHYSENHYVSLWDIIDELKNDSQDYLAMFVEWYARTQFDEVEIIITNDCDDDYSVEISQAYLPKQDDRNALIDKVIYDLVLDHINTWDEDDIKSRMNNETCAEYSDDCYEEYCEQEYERQREEG